MAQVGIRTENPQGMLHVDAKGDTGNLLKDTIDDVVVTPEGRLGIGTIHPQTRLDIVSSTPGAIRIADGTQGDGKLLVSDAYGAASWEVTSGWYAELNSGSSTASTSLAFTGSDIYPAGEGSVSVANGGAITVPYTGVYRILFCGMADCSNSTDWFYPVTVLLINGVDALSGNGSHHPHMRKSLGAMTFGCEYLCSLMKDDEVALRARQQYSYDANEYADTMLLVEYVRWPNQ
jgi:hypothetical protein